MLGNLDFFYASFCQVLLRAFTGKGYVGYRVLPVRESARRSAR